MAEARQFGRRQQVSAVPASGNQRAASPLILIFAGIGFACALVVAAGSLMRGAPEQPTREAVETSVPAVNAEDALNILPVSADNQVTVTAPGPAWLFVREQEQRTCAKDSCGSIGRIYFHQKVDVYLLHDGWAQISKRYDAGCSNGVTDYVRVGDNRCIPTNGFLDGRIALWVPVTSLTATEPPEAGANVADDAKFLAGSDNIDLYERQFLAGAREMVRRGYCTNDEMQHSGGFLKSASRKNEAVYFILCGDERPYLNVETGEVTRGR